jgi:hypothetical protein
MAFQKGNKLGRGGKQNPPGGRPTKEETIAKAEMRREALDALCGGMISAVNKLLEHLSTPDARISIRAAEKIVEFALRAYEAAAIDQRLTEIENRLEEKTTHG